MATSGGNRSANRIASGQCDCCDAWVSDEGISLCSWNQDGSENSPWHSALLEYSLNLQGDKRDVGSVFEYGGIASHERRGRKAEDLPVREIPGHQSQDDA